VFKFVVFFFFFVVVTLRENDFGFQSNMRQSRESSTSSVHIRRSISITENKKEVCNSSSSSSI
jgi:hypothetical protein